MKKLLILISLAFCLLSSAEVTYDAEKNSICIEGFPPEMPCTMKSVMMADKINGWGRVKYDKAASIWTIDANVIIGGNKNVSGCLKLGNDKVPDETLVVNGLVTVYPYFVGGLNTEKNHLHTKRNVNALIIGDPENDKIRPTLKIGKNGNLRIGYLPEYKGKVQFGGELRVYNGTISAAEGRFGDDTTWLHIYSKIILRNATISGFKGILRDISRFSEVSGTTFANGGKVVIGKTTIKNCAFRKLGCAVYDYGSLDAVFINCTFVENSQNFCLRFGKGVECIDCDLGEPASRDVYQMREYKGKKIFPEFISRRHIIVKVLDASGKPSPGAKVSISCEQGEKAVIKTVTGNDGCTPGRNGQDAILLTHEAKVATETPNKPQKTEFTYTISAENQGMAGVAKKFNPAKSWQEITVKLSK